MTDEGHATPSEMALEDFERAFGLAVDVAFKLLKGRGQMYPFGVAVNVDGRVGNFHADIPGGEAATPDVARAFVLDQFEEMRPELRAVGLVSHTQNPSTGEQALKVQLDHSNGECIELYMPFTMTESETSGRDLAAAVSIEAASGNPYTVTSGEPFMHAGTKFFWS